LGMKVCLGAYRDCGYHVGVAATCRARKRMA
jgi:hypothetical protein